MSTQCKVDRVRDAYGLSNLEARIRRRRENEDASLRSLEEFLNQLILLRAMESVGMAVLDGEAENYYRLLTDEEVTESARREAESELQQEGLDIEQVTEDFVSYRTIKKHLNECLCISTSREYEPDVDSERKRLSKLAARVKTVASKILDRLEAHEAIHIEDPRFSIDIHVRCGNCNRRHDLLEFLHGTGVCPCVEGAVPGQEKEEL
ncbi:rod-determining factor RdfA [Halorubellus salinus]|uniref:rod-determining factor RdfA n=1 Tax=Halorubellus salinus TaxID=755309 RepID=UPI001D076DCA|nr:rod-determining factor RdfA [Halorubellus salinus]